MNSIRAISLAIGRQLRSVKEALEIVSGQFAMAPILLGKEVLTQDGHSIGSITDMYLDLEKKTGQIIVAKYQRIPVGEIIEMGNKIIISRTWRELITRER